MVSRIRKRKIIDGVCWYYVQMAVIDLEARNDQTCPFATECSFLGVSDVCCYLKQMLGKINGEVGPLIYLENWDN